MKVQNHLENIIENAAAILKNGGLVGLPTETVYGLGADATNANAIAKIFELKNRPQFNPLISHVTDIEMARKFGKFDEVAVKLALAFWPGPLTIIVPRVENCEVCDLACAGLETIALRAPKHEIAQKILIQFAGPIAAPSANISGNVSPTSARHVESEFGANLDFIIDGGDCEIGLESTVVSVLDGNITILRHGAISAEDIEKAIGFAPQIADLHDEKSPKSPGMMLRHYAPRAPSFMNSIEKNNGEVLIGIGEMDCDFNLSRNSNLSEAAANLYKYLRQADELLPKAIRIAPIPAFGIGIAINDRLSRAIVKSA